MHQQEQERKPFFSEDPELDNLVPILIHNYDRALCLLAHLYTSVYLFQNLFTVALLLFFSTTTAPPAGRGNQGYDRTLLILIQYSFKALILILSRSPPPLSPA